MRTRASQKARRKESESERKRELRLEPIRDCKPGLLERTTLEGVCLLYTGSEEFASREANNTRTEKRNENGAVGSTGGGGKG